MAFVERKISVTIQILPGPDGKPRTFVESGTDVVTLSGLRTSVKIVKGGGPGQSSMDLEVWGMSPSLMNQLSTLGIRINLLARSNVTVSAGDDIAGMGIVFVGQVFNAYANFEGAPDVSFCMTATSSAADAVISFPPSSFEGQVDVATFLSGIAEQLGLSFENNGVSGKLSNSYFAGSARDQAAAAVAHVGCSWIIDNGILAIWPKNGSRGGTVPLISSGTGMIGYPAYTATGVIVRTVFNPNIAFGGKVKVESSLVPASRAWRVAGLALELDANMPGGQWSSVVNCADPDFAAPVLQP